MNIVELFNSIKVSKLEDKNLFRRYKAYCYKDPAKLKELINEVDIFIQNLLDTKAKAKKIYCLQQSSDCWVYEFYVNIRLDKLFARLEIDRMYNELITIDIYTFYSKQDIEMLKDDKKYKHIYKIIEKAEELTSFTSTDVYVSDYDFFIYTINRLIDFLRVVKEELKENLEFLTKEIC